MSEVSKDELLRLRRRVKDIENTDNDSLYEPKNSNIQSHIGDTANPHNVTKAQVGLGSVTNNAQWHAGNDGLGSGLDADLLGGVMQRICGSNTATGTGTLTATAESAFPSIGLYLVFAKLFGSSNGARISGIFLVTHNDSGDNIAVAASPQYYDSSAVADGVMSVTVNASSYTYLSIEVYKVA
jgi:hypothetical protein